MAEYDDAPHGARPSRAAPATCMRPWMNRVSRGPDQIERLQALTAMRKLPRAGL